LIHPASYRLSVALFSTFAWIAKGFSLRPRRSKNVSPISVGVARRVHLMRSAILKNHPGESETNRKNLTSRDYPFSRVARLLPRQEDIKGGHKGVTSLSDQLCLLENIKGSRPFLTTTLFIAAALLAGGELVDRLARSSTWSQRLL
jgi:hypothetical protein